MLRWNLNDVAEFKSDPREGQGSRQRVSIAKISGSRELDMDIILPSPGSPLYLLKRF